MAELSVDVRGRGDVAVIDLQGEMDGRADAAFGAAYAEAAAGRPQAIIFNFANVDYINSTGIALIVGALANARKESIVVRAVGLSDHYRHIFEITRLADFMTFHNGEDEALGEEITAPA